MNQSSWLNLIFAIFLTGCTASSDDFGSILENGAGGTGTASIAITSFSPGNSTVALKATATQQFLVSAVGEGTLLYQWTVDGTTVGANSPSFSLDASQFSVGNHTLKLALSDEIGSASQEWTVKINGSPVIGSSAPTANAVYLRRNSQMSFSVNVTDPNSDTLTYVWKLNGQEGILTSTTATATWTPATVDVGSHTVSVDIYDGPISDSGTYKVTRSWTTYVNHFSDACNKMENESQTNMTCVLSGIPGIGDGKNPEATASAIYMRPASLTVTSQNNLFIGDDSNHVVWFYNKYTSPSVTVLGVTVPINTMKVVAGVGIGSSGNSASNKALRTFLNSPHGLSWDGSNLYISDTSNNRVIRVDSNGEFINVYTSGCNSPRGLTVTGGFLYVACFAHHKVVKIDTTSLVMTTFAGNGTAANPTNLNETTFTDTGNGRLNNPYGLTSDADGNIYVGEHAGCRVRLYNQSGSDITLYGSYVIGDGKQRVIAGAVGGATCGVATGEPIDFTAAANATLGNVRDLTFDSAGNLLIAVDQDRIAAINFSSTAKNIFGVAINGYELKSLLGSGTAGYIGEGQPAATTRFNNPFAIAWDTTTNDLYVADNANLRLRKFKDSTSKTELIAGNGSHRGATNAGQGTLEVGQEKMSNIRGFAVDSVTGEIFVADSNNHRIRGINRYGLVSQSVGTGTSGSGAEEMEFPSNVTMNQPRGLVLTHKTATFGGHLVWADSQNHRVRIWNRSTTDQTLFGVTVGAGLVATIGGDGNSGNATSGVALQAAFNQPSGVTSDGTNLYVADMANHCIKQIDENGNLSAFAGTCGTSGNVNGAVGVGRMSNPEGIDYYSNGVHKGLIIAARGNTRIKFHRIAGSSLLFGGSTSIGDTNNIACGGTFHTENINANLASCNSVYDVAAVDGKVCFSNQNYHNVRCIQSTGEISTVIGQVQGLDDTTNLYAPGGAFTHEDYSASTPNYGAQNGVPAFYLPSPIAEPGLNVAFGRVTYPISVGAINGTTLLVGEYTLGLIRKVKLP